MRQTNEASGSLEPKRKITLARWCEVRITLPGRCTKKVRNAGFVGSTGGGLTTGGCGVTLREPGEDPPSLPQSPSAAASSGFTSDLGGSQIGPAAPVSLRTASTAPTASMSPAPIAQGP